MNNNDMQSNIRTKHVINVAIGANGTLTGKIIDRKGYSGVEFVLGYGAVTTTGSIATVVVKEGDATGSMTSVADSNLLGTEALASLLAGARTSGTGQNVGKRIGYIGNKRYVQVNVVKTGTTSVGTCSVQAILFNPESAPVTNP